MSRTPLDNLPDDPAVLKAIVAMLERQHDEAERQRDEARHKVQSLEAKAQSLEAQTQALEIEKLRLEMELLRLKKWYYGPRADTLATPGDVAQMLLAFATDLDARPVDPQDCRHRPTRMRPRTHRSAACAVVAAATWQRTRHLITCP
jgi:hypothetical protein